MMNLYANISLKENYHLHKQGREDVLEQIHHYVTGNNQRPLVLFGESGCGKTSLMAKAASQVMLLFGNMNNNYHPERSILTNSCNLSIN